MIITKKRILVASLLPLIIIGFFVLRFFFTLYISSSSPSLGSVSYQTPSLELTFNKPLRSSSVRVEGNGVIFEDKVSTKGSTIKLYLNSANLSAGKEASFSLKAVSSDDFKYDDTVRFTPRDISFSDLPSDQQKEIKRLEGERPRYYTDPIMRHIPYSTLSYALAPNFVTTPDGATRLTINLTVYLSQVDLGNKSTIIKQRVAEAKAYLSSKGLDPDSYSFNLNIVGG